MSKEPEDTGTPADETLTDERPEGAVESPEAQEGGQPTTADLLAQMEAMKAEMAMLRQPVQPAVTPPTTEQAPSYEQQLRGRMSDIVSKTQQLESEIAVLATRGNDPVAAFQIQQKELLKTALEATAWSIQQVREEVYESKIGEDDRDDFRKFKEANRHRFADLESLHLAWDGKRHREQVAAVNRQRKAAEAIVDSKDRGVVATGTREVPAAELRDRKGPQKMTETAFDNKVTRLRAAGDFAGARALEKQYAEGLIELT